MVSYHYHCYRCNYDWFPEGFDRSPKDIINTDYGNVDLFFREPPKSCARCKSKSWNSEYMKRKRKGARLDSYGRIKETNSRTRDKVLKRAMTSIMHILKIIVIRPDYLPYFIKILEGRNTPEAIAEFKNVLEEHCSNINSIVALEKEHPSEVAAELKRLSAADTDLIAETSNRSG